jgi:hypothetical protein
MIIVDEAARVPDAMFIAILPMLIVSRGRLLCLSTPFGRRGWFFEQWMLGGPTWERIKAKATECPRIDPEYLAEQKRLLGPRAFAQEHECEFTEAEDQAFSSESIDAIFSGGQSAPVLDF